MRTAIILLFTCVFISVAETGHSQNAKVTLNKNKVNLKEVLNEIENQTDYLFIYNNEVNTNRTVSVKTKNGTVRKVLNHVLKDSDIDFLMEGNHIILSYIERKLDEVDKNIKETVEAVVQQGRTVTGRVTDLSGESLPGVTILIKGTSKGTITDVDGNFTLTDISESEILQFSYVGMQTQDIVIGNQARIDVTMVEDAIGLEEIVAVGYGTMRKSDLTGAVMRADLTTLQNSPQVNVLDGIKGLVPGLNIGVATRAGDDPSISIRGRNSISGSNNPLIVLDGIIYRGSFTDINPADIQSIDVLKDASSAAIYGSQAANGVLFITSKTSQTITSPILEYSGSITHQKYIKNLEPLDRDGYMKMFIDGHMKSSRIGDDFRINPDYDPTGDFKRPEDLIGYIEGTDTDWLDLLSVKFPYLQNHNMSIRGKNEQTSYFLSFGATDQKNAIKNDTYKRYSFRVNFDAKLTNWLKVGTNSFLTVSDLSGNNPSFSSVLGTTPLVTPYDEEGELKTIYWAGSVNPLLYLTMPDEEKRYNLSGVFYGEVNLPLRGMTYKINYSQNLVHHKHYLFNPYANGLMGEAQKDNNMSNTWSLDNILNYKNSFNYHEFETTLVYGVEKRNFEATKTSANNFKDKTLGYNRLQLAQADLNKLSSSAWEESSLYMMGRINYIYNSRYLATLTLRRDGFSGFGEKNKFSVFPSASLAWRISEEEFFKNRFANIIDNLKIRSSYGQSGNRTIGRYATLASMRYDYGYVYGDGGSPELLQTISNMENPNLKWETTTSLNMGLDFSILNNRMHGSFEFYNSNTSDLLYDVQIPTMNGVEISQVAINIGEIRNHGYELNLSGMPIKTKNWEWNSTFNFSLNRNKVVSILGIDSDGDGQEDDLVSANIFINHPLGVIYDFNVIGMWQIDDYNRGVIPTGSTYGTYKVEDINGDGKYTKEFDRKILGYTDPSYYFSWHNRIRYKQFELNAFINSIQGGSKYYYGAPMSSFGINRGVEFNFFDIDYWTPENPNAKYRQVYQWNQNLGSNFHPYQQRSFIRLQEISLTYYLPETTLSRLSFIKRGKVFLTGNNLLTISSWEGWDPEADQGVSYNLPGNGYPTMKSYTFGLNFEF